ncbi:hypothetical protein PV328_008495 [Microctonus aethiopoides]|uniref:Uncharacterized protein n=1 Tax=Microctonus aethiopoides TaxID=144406 RepID=A0AA39FJC8_9HYME|nr:hypothetical protein PV328_008495 [Microctonus aethiopoides]
MHEYIEVRNNAIEELVEAVFSDHDENQGEKSDAIERKRKLQNKVRCQRYRDKRKSDITINSQISRNQTIATDQFSKPIAKHVPGRQNFHTSQIPETRMKKEEPLDIPNFNFVIQQFLFENLMIYTKEGSEILGKRFGKKYDEVPMILSGDFNINFADDKNLPLIEFLNETLNLNMSNDRKLKYNEIIESTNSLSIVEVNDDNDANNENNVKNQVH